MASKYVEYCPKCKKDQPVIKKMFNTRICVECSTITSSDKSYKG